jgi:hypothetical protein
MRVGYYTNLLSKSFICGCKNVHEKNYSISSVIVVNKFVNGTGEFWRLARSPSLF